MRKGLVPIVVGAAILTGGSFWRDEIAEFAVGNTSLREPYRQLKAFENRMRYNEEKRLGYTESELQSFQTSADALRTENPQLSSYQSARKNMDLGIAGAILGGMFTVIGGVYRALPRN